MNIEEIKRRRNSLKLTRFNKLTYDSIHELATEWIKNYENDIDFLLAENKRLMNDTVYVVIDLFGKTDSIAGATIDINTANMLCASALEGHSRFIEMYENGVKVGEGGFREENEGK